MISLVTARSTTPEMPMRHGIVHSDGLQPPFRLHHYRTAFSEPVLCSVQDMRTCNILFRAATLCCDLCRSPKSRQIRAKEGYRGVQHSSRMLDIPHAICDAHLDSVILISCGALREELHGIYGLPTAATYGFLEYILLKNVRLIKSKEIMEISVHLGCHFFL